MEDINVIESYKVKKISLFSCAHLKKSTLEEWVYHWFNKFPKHNKREASTIFVWLNNQRDEQVHWLYHNNLDDMDYL